MNMHMKIYLYLYIHGILFCDILLVSRRCCKVMFVSFPEGLEGTDAW